MYTSYYGWVTASRRYLLPPFSRYKTFKIESGVKMEAAGPSEMLVPVYQATRRHILEDRSFDV